MEGADSGWFGSLEHCLGDTRHVLFDHVREFLMAHGFHVYGFYDQNLEWSGESRLRFVNACFANEEAFRR